MVKPADEFQRIADLAFSLQVASAVAARRANILQNVADLGFILSGRVSHALIETHLALYLNRMTSIVEQNHANLLVNTQPRQRDQSHGNLAPYSIDR